MHQSTLTMCCLVLPIGFAAAFGPSPDEARKKLQGTWTATKAQRDGKAAEDVVGHRLSFTGERFQIRSKDDKLLYEGTFRLDPSMKPAAIRQMSAQSIRSRMWDGSAWRPPRIRQCAAVCSQSE